MLCRVAGRTSYRCAELNGVDVEELANACNRVAILLGNVHDRAPGRPGGRSSRGVKSLLTPSRAAACPWASSAAKAQHSVACESVAKKSAPPKAACAKAVVVGKKQQQIRRRHCVRELALTGQQCSSSVRVIILRRKGHW